MQDLAAAEAKAESDALSASQGPTSLKGKDVPALEIPQDQAAFEEETLQSVSLCWPNAVHMVLQINTLAPRTTDSLDSTAHVHFCWTTSPIVELAHHA